MIVWGGTRRLQRTWNDGGRYDPAADSWTAVSPTGAPTPRANHTAVWTGSEMIVWGGSSGASFLNDGGRYHPAANTWTAPSATGAPAARAQSHGSVDGRRDDRLGRNRWRRAWNDGGRYDPAADSWTAVSPTSAPTPRFDHTAVWTGSEMIVWGGASGVA